MRQRVTLVLSAALSAALVMSACGSSNNSTPSPPSPAPAGAMVSIVVGARTLGAMSYSPNPLTVSVGTTVTWVNNDSIAHTATSNTPGGFDTGNIAAGAQASRQFTTAGSFAYHCTYHPGMVATINVQ